MALTFASSFMVSTYYAYPTFKLSNAVLLLATLLLESESWDHVQKFPPVRKSPPLPYPSGSCIKSRHALHWTW